MFSYVVDMEVEKDGKYFQSKYNSATDQYEKDMCYEEILGMIHSYNEQIFSILENENISEEYIQNKIIKYQSKKTDCLATYNTLKRKEEMDYYTREIIKATKKEHIFVLQEALDQQKITAPTDHLFFTEEEKQTLLEEMEAKIKLLTNKKRKTSIEENTTSHFFAS